MKGQINHLTLKYGTSPVSIREMSQTINKNESCILVYDEIGRASCRERV